MKLQKTNTMFEKRILNVYSIVLGVFLLIAGFGKASDTTAFANLIGQYGFGYLAGLSPFIVLLEITLGLMFVFLVYVKRMALVSVIVLSLFTALFVYANIANGVTDCGCFGTSKHTNMPAFMTYLRNGLMLSLSIILWLKYPDSGVEFSKWKVLVILSVLVLSVFYIGYTFKGQSASSSSEPEHAFKGKHINSTALKSFVKTSPDKTYLVFCFSYTCPYCLNSIENLREYQKNNTVDSLICFAAFDPKTRAEFNANFKPDFAITELRDANLGELTNIYPTAFFIKNDTVKYVIQGVLMSSFVFKKSYPTF